LQVKRFSLHSQPVRHISFDDKAEYVASCCGENYVSVSSSSSSSSSTYTTAAVQSCGSCPWRSHSSSIRCCREEKEAAAGVAAGSANVLLSYECVLLQASRL
jgi:hypothetical protein